MGASQGTETDYTIGSLADDTAALMDALDVDKADLVVIGLSSSGSPSIPVPKLVIVV